MIALHDVGVDTAVGALGTAITKQQLDLASKVSDGPDGDHLQLPTLPLPLPLNLTS